MLEPDVTLTDYALAVECAVLCVLLRRTTVADSRPRIWWGLLFASVGVGSLLGGTAHGFFPDQRSHGYVALWTGTLLALGVTSVAMWIAGANAGLSDPARLWIARASAVMFAAYTFVVLFVSTRFVVAIAAYLPAAVFLLAIFVMVGRQGQRSTYGIVGIGLSFVAAAVQQMRIALHPTYFNHNALYHLIQGVGLALLFVGARQLLQGGGTELETTRGR